MQRRDYELLRPKWYLHHFSPHKDHGSLQKKDGENDKNQGSHIIEENYSFQAQQGKCTQELPIIMTISQELYKSNQDKVTTWKESLSMKPHSQLRSYWHFIATTGVIFQGITPNKLIVLHGRAHTKVQLGITNWYYNNNNNKTLNCVGSNVRWIYEELVEGRIKRSKYIEILT